MKNRNFKKTLSVFLSVLMILSCWVWIAPTDAEAANTYYVRVYLNIYDGANSDGYGNPYTVVTDPNSDFYGKPDDYKWDYGSSWSLTDNSAGYDGEINMAGFTLFYDNDTKYETYDLAADLVNATTVLGNNWTSMDDLTLENFASWPNKEEKVYGFTLDAMPSSLFWINDENNAVNGETSFGIYKITVAETSTSQEHILWTGLSGSESYYECYYGTITPTGIITPWDDCPDATTYTFYKDYTTSAIGTWIDPFNAGDYNVYPVNNYLSGGVSASFTVGNSGSQTNIDFVDVGNTNNYYINFTNHSTQDATITLFKADNQSLLSGYYDNYPIPSGKTVSFALNKSSMGGDGDYVDFSFKFKLNNVYNSDGTTQTDFYQAAGIGTWNTSDDSKEIGYPEGETKNKGFTLYNGSDIDVMNQFMADQGIFEVISTTGNRTSNATFEYNYWVDSSNASTWQDVGLRMRAEKWSYYRLHLQPSGTTGTINITGDMANTGTVSISMADLLLTYNKADINVPDKSNRPWAYYNTPCTPYWQGVEEQKWGTLWNDSTPAYFPFCGEIIKGSTTSSNPGKIVFNNMTWRCPGTINTNNAYFSGTINVYSFDKTQLREYVYSLGGLGANWAPMRTRFNDAQWNAYEIALKTAKEVLANQKTNQKAVTDAYNALYSATEALKATSSLKSQVAEVTYTQRETDYASTAIQTKQKYIIMPIGTQTAVPAYDTYKYASSGNIVGKQTSNLKTNYTQYDTGINPIDYRYWKIDYTGVSEAIAEATALLDSPLDTYSDAYYEALFDARTSVSYFDRDADTWTPTYQSDISNPLAELNALLAHAENNYDACIYDGSDEDTDADIVNENYNCIDGGTVEHVCIICGKAKVVETKDPQEGGHTLTYVNNNDGTHTATCTECDFSETADHVFTNPVLVRPTLVDGTWTDGTYTYTCICGAEKVEPAVRADYSELEEVVDALEALKDNENLTDEAKEAINAAIKKADDLADDLVTAEQKQIDDLVKELQKVKADAEEAIRNKEIGVEKITEANSGVKVQFIDESGLGAIDSIQLGKDEGFIIRAANGNADSDITITKLNGDAVNKTLASGESTDFNISADGLTAGIATYTITYTIDGLKDADGNLVEFTTEAYLYVKEEAYQPYHYLHEVAWQGQDMALQYYVEANYGDFTANNPTGAEKFNDNMEVNEVSTWRYDKYDYGTTCYDANCTGGTNCTAKSDAHLATYNYYVDTSLVKTWEDAGFRTRFVETAASNYDKVNLKYLRLAVNQTYLDGIAGDDKTFTVTFVPSASGTANATMQFSSTGDLTIQHIVEPANDTLLFGSRSTNATNNTAYANFSGTIPVGVNADGTAPAMFMFAPKLRMTGGLAADEASYMTTHIALTSYDKAALREAVANAEQAGYNSEYFNPEKYEAYENALKNAKEVLGKAETNQNEIDAATAALNAAIADLEKAENEAKFVLTVTHSIHESADKNSEATGTEYDYYLVNGLVTPALKADVIARDTINKYDDVVTLNVTADSAHTYNYWYIDYSGVQGAIDAADEIINDTTTGYSDEYKQDVKDAKDALQNVLDGKDITTTPESQSTVNDAIDAVTALTGHTHNEDVVIPAVDPTCTDDGLTVGAKCSVCGKITIAQETDPKTGHNYDKNDDGEITRADAVYTAPVETDGIWSDAVYTYTCQNNCGASYTETVARADYEEYDKAVEDLNELLEDTTLTEDAKKKINEALEENDIADNLDSDSQQTVTDAADALKDVIDEITGENKDKYTKVDFSAYKEALEIYSNITVDFANTDEKAAVQNAIDSLDGITAESAKVPDNQDKIDAATGVIKAINDKYAECAAGKHGYESVTTDPTCTAQGYTTHTCKVCGNSYKDTFTGPDGHDWSEWALTVAPTKDTEGTYTRTCSKGDATETKSVARENYTDYDAAVERAEDMLDNNKLTEAAKDEIREALEKAEELDQNLPADVIEDGETVIDNDSAEKIAEATEDLTEVLDKIANDKTGAYEKVDYTNYDNAVDAYEALKDTMTDEDKAAVGAIKAEIAEIPADGTKKDYQAQVDKAAEDIAAINVKYGDCANGNHTWGEPVLTKDPTADEQGEYTETCEVCGATQITKVALANYGEFNKVVGQLEALLNTENLTDESKKAIEDALAKAEALDKNLPDDATTVDGKLIEGGQDEIDTLVNELKDVVADTNAAIADGSALKPDYTAWETAEGTYDALDKTNVKAEIITEANNLKAAIAEKQADKSHTQATATQAEINAATARLNEIIAGINNGTYKNPDYSGAETAIQNAKDTADNENIPDSKEAEIEAEIAKLEEELQNLKDTNPDSTNAEAMEKINEIKAEAEAIVEKYKDCVAGTHDYADATCTAPETCKDCGATNGDPLDHVDTDNDHICNNGCNGKISDCSDVTTDTDHNCDICGAADVTEHNYVGSVLTRPTKNDDGTWNNGYYTSTCNCGATSTTEAKRANYTAYDEAVADLNELLADATLTDEAIAKINKVLTDNKIDDNLVTAEQSIVDDAAAALKVVLDEINGNKDAYQKPDAEDAIDAVEAAEALEEKIEMPQSDKDKIDELRETLDEILEEIEADDNATAEEYQDRLKAVEDEAKEILEKYKDCTDVHEWDDGVLTKRPELADGTWVDGYYTYTCENCGTTKTEPAARANYTAYDSAVAELNELLADETLTDAAKSEINAVLSGNKIADNYIATADEQAIVDAAAAALKVVLDKIKNDTTGAYLKPDYEAWEEAEGAYDALDKTNVKDEIINEANALKAEIADKQADDSLTQATATQDDIDDATERLNEIIDGINDGSLKDPDYSKVEEKLEDVNEAEGLNKDTQDKIDAIEKELQDIKDKTEPEANAKDDQVKVDALEDLLDEILEDIADGTAKAPDYTNWDSAEGTYDALDKTNVKDEILDEVTDLKNTINNLKADPTANAKEDQKTIDDATKRLLEIIDGITDGSLLNPDAECVHDYATVEVEPTCHSVGYTLYVCKKCKDSYKVNGAPAIDHNWKWSESKTGSCLEAKTRTGYCLNDGCNATKTEYVRDADGNIVYGNHVYVVIEGKPATCTTPGHTDYTRCVNCGEITESVTIPAPGHIDSDNNGNCDVCNYLTKPAVGKCDCLCHNDSFFGKLIYKIANFFWKLFKINQGCQCGVQHW